ncbi:MAG: aminotransferase class I/II-fold pyridoxal phosphate-dependent enzyme [Aphanocapsa feldmannii 277cV]|uniref:Aminotransferase class I/II-fold pyridoxal phosphate-dependent enzyme n=1 Tax=Aphanocapsa feldmannii 277cV TaxID=2507553 RepID=A0A524RR83_9CHRO|nr:MAG: aminotransferase class I/II-fold pyridoxal phosphate-dependent enzyme [Aphanocapsa feldmannii 277cV]
MADRFCSLEAGVFARIDRAKQAARDRGLDLIDLSLGSTDQLPPPATTAAIAAAVPRADSAAYCLHAATGPCREAIAAWVSRRFDVAVDPDRQVLLLVGSQEGTAHLPLAVLNPGDHALVLDPGYPSHRGGLALAAAQVQRLTLRQEDGWRPRWQQLSPLQLRQLRLMVLGYPHNPTATTGQQSWVDEAAALCAAHGIVLAHDNPYVDLALDGEAPALLRSPHWQRCGIEFFSFSKSWCLGGFRIAFAVGAEPLIAALRNIKGFIDFNQSLAIQAGAVAALEQAPDWPTRLRMLYRHRRDHMVQALAGQGWPLATPGMALYLWDRLPAGEQRDSLRFCLDLVRDTGVALTPGSGFGAAGEGYVRLALVHELPRLEEAAARIGHWLRS